LFFLPFLLIQAHGYSATAAGAVYLPFTLILALLSRWSGGLADRFGTRAPLVVGPVIAGAGFAVLGGIAGTADYCALAAAIAVGRPRTRQKPILTVITKPS